MKLPDATVLIYAFRADMPQHATCKSWIDRMVVGPTAFAMCRPIMSSVVRITTDKAFNMSPSGLEEAFGFCEDLASQPNCRLVEPGERHWAIFERLCRDTETTGTRVSDAWFAALAIEHGCEWVTLDRDFARFPGLKWSVPK
jgi:uncharacterized protein